MEWFQHLGTHEYVGEQLVDAVDWITTGAVAPVKNHGQHGSGWAFSLVKTIDGDPRLVPREAQQL